MRSVVMCALSLLIAWEPAAAQSTAPVREPRTAADVALDSQRGIGELRALAFDLSFRYDRRDAPFLVLDDDSAGVDSVESETLSSAVLVRYSASDRIELALGATARTRTVTLYDGESNAGRTTLGNFGDVTVGLRYAWIDERENRPEVSLTTTAQLPTADTPAAFGAALTLLKTVDPLVLYASAGYRYEAEDDAASNAPHALELTFGQGFAVNDAVALTSALSTTLASGGRGARARRRSTLDLGLTARLSSRFHLQPTLSQRLDGIGNSFAFELNVAYTTRR